MTFKCSTTGVTCVCDPTREKPDEDKDPKRFHGLKLFKNSALQGSCQNLLFYSDTTVLNRLVSFLTLPSAFLIPVGDLRYTLPPHCALTCPVGILKMISFSLCHDGGCLLASLRLCHTDRIWIFLVPNICQDGSEQGTNTRTSQHPSQNLWAAFNLSCLWLILIFSSGTETRCSPAGVQSRTNVSHCFDF